MLRCTKKVFVAAMTFFGCNVLNVNPLKCVSMNNQERKIRPQIMSINSDEHSFYPYSVKQINSVVVVIILMIYSQNYVFLMLLNT